MDKGTTFTIVNSKKTMLNIVGLTVVVFAATIAADFIIDIKALSVKPILPFFIINLILLLLLEHDKISLKWFKIIQLVLIFGALEITFLLNAKSYHALIYWMVYIPTITIILLGLRTSIFAISLVVLTNLVNAVIGFQVNGPIYNLDLGYVPFFVAGTIFATTVYLIMHRFYILLQNSYKNVNKQKAEIEDLNAQLSEYNANLRTDLEKTTKDATTKSMRLERIAYNNSHVVRAPLVNILSAVDLIGTENNDDELIKIIKQNAKKLDAVISEIGSLSHDD